MSKEYWCRLFYGLNISLPLDKQGFINPKITPLLISAYTVLQMAVGDPHSADKMESLSHTWTGTLLGHPSFTMACPAATEALHIPSTFSFHLKSVSVEIILSLQHRPMKVSVHYYLCNRGIIILQSLWYANLKIPVALANEKSKPQNHEYKILNKLCLGLDCDLIQGKEWRVF